MDDFGGKLRQARERRGISLRQIAASTKISASALEALERNDISKLPGGLFSRAFVRSYAVEVGLDPDETVREFLDRFDQETPPTAQSVAAEVPEHEREFEEQRRRAALVVKATLISLPILAVVLYFALRGRGGSLRATPSETPASSTVPAVVETPAPAPAQPPVPAADAAPAPPVPAGQIRLDLHPTAECWVSLTVDGKKLFARVMQPGERQVHDVAREAVVEVGDAGVFAYSINGREAKPLGNRGQVKTLRLTPATVEQYIR
jgi:cytoskeleton protein RodZ